MPPSDYPPADHMQQISQITYEEARDYGIPESYMTVIPLGIYPQNFSVTASKGELRKKYDIADDTFVVLCLAAINRYHKRIDYLIDEFESIEGNLLLWIDGSLDQGDPDLLQYAQDRLGDRCRITHLQTSEVGELFAVADLMAHTALFEAFGLALVEGASTGMPVLTHNAPHFRWLMNNQLGAIDMSIEGELARRIDELIVNRSLLQAMCNDEQILNRFSWQVLKQDYLDMYLETANLTADEFGVAHSFGLK